MLEIQNLQEEVPFDEALWAVVEKVAQKIAEDAGIGPFEASVTIVDDAGIRKTNREFRGIDAATDVLSFPMADTASGGGAGGKPGYGRGAFGGYRYLLAAGGCAGGGIRTQPRAGGGLFDGPRNAASFGLRP